MNHPSTLSIHKAKQPCHQIFEIKWATGQVERVVPSEQGTEEMLTVAFGGDWAPTGAMASSSKQEPENLYTELEAYLGETDFNLVNLEASLCVNGPAITKDGPALCIDSEALSSLKQLRCNVACLANNHIMDFGTIGLQQTLKELERLGIQHVGVIDSVSNTARELIVEKGSLRFAIVNVAEGEEGKAKANHAGAVPLLVDDVCQQVTQLAQLTNGVLVVIHAGREYLPVPAPYIQRAYRKIAEAGASIIVAHHPHVSQGVEVWNGVPIFYSLGNLLMSGGPYVNLYRSMGYLVVANLEKKRAFVC